MATQVNPEGSAVDPARARSNLTLLPEPQPSRLRVPIVSVDDHFVEPAHLFLTHMPKRFGDRIPRVVETEGGVESWQLEDELIPMRGPFSAIGRPRSEWSQDGPLRFDEMRPGSYEPTARLRDMDLAGVAMSLCFPSAAFGFAGQQFSRLRDRELGLAAMRAYNDWTIDEWVATNPSRFIAQQIPWFHDPSLAGAEVRRNSERGFRAVTFSENPEALGFPSLYTDYWDPFLSACAETGTVVNLHIGSSSTMNRGSTGAPTDVTLALFPVNAIVASVDWLYARIPTRFPGLRIVLSESGISWVPMIHERLRRNIRMAESEDSTWRDEAETPEETFKRAFWFTSIEDPSGIESRAQIGLDRIMLEVDYPHPDSSWPDTQDVVFSELGHIPPDEMRLLAYENAAKVYGISISDIERVSAELLAVAGKGHET
jgi:predicted TIM-barrel fold metal-dependent hydrolase